MDLYFHAKECSQDTPFDEMKLDDEVEFEVKADDRSGKPMGIKVTLVGGGSKKRSRSRSGSKKRSRSNSE